jgi:hypothetical protein
MFKVPFFALHKGASLEMSVNSKPEEAGHGEDREYGDF